MKLYLEIVVQTFLAFFSILFIARLLGRQQISQLTFHEYVNGITFGSIAAALATDLDSHTMQHFVGLILFGALTGIISLISLKYRSFRKVIEGEPIVIIQNGKILENSMKRARYHIDEINVLLRQKECSSPEEVEYGILETNGQLSIFKRPDKKAATLGDLNIAGSPDTIPTELIIGGQIIYENLKKRNLTGKDLINKLKMFGVNKVEEVVYATIDQNGKVYVDKYEDNMPNALDTSENNQ